ncbi:PstS family phosphate ABC transporter substrate-binding protein [Synechocystis sp. LKSZ1]|uniref:PstS family phosphate ABC transporter substrate-binding protein n=1 Tax=Synechocystis sp. LKSZ1 TaxID=3144951 RepID=UPI00336BE768
MAMFFVNSRLRAWCKPGLLLGLGLSLFACSGPTKEPITIDGSSTVYPISKAMAEAYQKENPEAPAVEVKFSGTTGGFRQFCEGKTQVSDASRPITQAEIDHCNKNNIRFIELPVAFDALTLVVNPQNTWVTSLTVADLKKMWQPSAENTIKKWNQIQPNFPDKPLTLFGAGTDSGTFDYFTEAIVGKAGASRMDYVKTEDDQITVQGVEQDPNAIGYFGLAYYEKAAKQLKPVAIDSGKGPILPSRETVEKGQYNPLSRPLLVYANLEAAQKNDNLKDFMEFYLTKAPEVVPQVGYIPLPKEGYHLASVTFHNGEVGTVFEGHSQIGLTISELLRKKAKF